MGGAIARAVCKAADPQNVYLANRTACQSRKTGRGAGLQYHHQRRRWQARCDLIFLAVKPQMMEALLAPLKLQR